MLKLYDYSDSGNGYKVRLLLNQLGREYELIEKDILAGETRTPEFLSLNPNGRIPLLQTEEGSHLPESNAILFYLAEGTDFLPGPGLERAQTLQWMFFEQYSHEPNIATSRFLLRHRPDSPERQAALNLRRGPGKAALAVMERHLTDRDFFVAGRYTIADMALYAYTHVADQGGFDLAPYPALNRWLDQVAAQPGYFPMLEEG